MKLPSGVLFALALAATVLSLQASQAAGPPNIIFILADDLGYADLGCYGQTNYQTPNIDRMASEGLRFTQHYAGSTVCAPSRACLLTGQHTGHVWQRANGKIRFRSNPRDLTVASMLKLAGYRTAMIGKSGVSCNDDDGKLPNKKGFDHFFGYVSHEAAHRHYPTSLWRNGKLVRYENNSGKEGDTYAGDVFRDDALAFIEAFKHEKFFLFLALQQPHADLAAPGEYRDRFLGKFDETPHPDGQHYRAEPEPKATYSAMVTHLDDTVGAVLKKLRELRIDRQTLVIFSSDNGPMSEGGWDRKYFDSNGPLRGGKRDLYEGGIRVPMIAWWPVNISPGRTTDHVSAFWDFVPTACQATGLTPPQETDGISYFPTLLGEIRSSDGVQRIQSKHDHLYWEFYERGGKQAVRMGDWKGVRLNVLEAPEAPIELYNLAEDIGEQNNIAESHPDIVSQIAQIMAEEHVPTRLNSLQNQQN